MKIAQVVSVSNEWYMTKKWCKTLTEVFINVLTGLGKTKQQQKLIVIDHWGWSTVKTTEN